MSQSSEARQKLTGVDVLTSLILEQRSMDAKDMLCEVISEIVSIGRGRGECRLESGKYALES